ncbi:hypothetical protein TYRP_015348 [Tyrophagus putrescentiae]|nr:hypothetical protein TYRP_015348 [Tyrophagus putrescentiae]
MYPHLRQTFYSVVRETCSEGTLPSGALKRRYQLYNAYYAYWLLFSVRLLVSVYLLNSSEGSNDQGCQKHVWYLSADISMATWSRVTNADATFAFIFALCCTFPITVYDIFVRNVDQFAANNGQLRIQLTAGELFRRPIWCLVEALRKVVQRVKGDRVTFSPADKMAFFPNTSPKVRCWILFIGWVYEAVNRLVYSEILMDALTKKGDFQALASGGHYLLLLINGLDFVAMHNLHITYTVILLSSFEYRHLNRCLRSVIMTILSSSSSANYHQAITSNHQHQIFSSLLDFRRQHTRLTTFILYTNDRILSPHFIAFLVTTFLASSYVIVLLTFHEVNPNYRTVFILFLVAQGIGFATTTSSFIPVNRMMLSSNRLLFAIMGRLGAHSLRTSLTPPEGAAGGDRGRKSSKWSAALLNSSSSSSSTPQSSLSLVQASVFREKWKLASYYELIYRSEKPLAISIGLYGPLTSSSFLQIIAMFLAYFLTFASTYRHELMAKEFGAEIE